MVKAYVGGILLALLALGYVTSAAQELPNHDNPEQLIEDALDENGYDQLEAMEDTALLSTADDEIEQLEDVLSKQEKVEEQRHNRCSNVFHSSTIALQSGPDTYYLGCESTPCHKAYCPGLHMEGSPYWTRARCLEMVFRIYRRSGPGAVRVGDEIGIYYPHEYGKWFGCNGTHCGKYVCPGYPESQFGFRSCIKWTECGDEVFTIYARGKDLRTPIVSNDRVFLYSYQHANWVGLVNDHSYLRTCPGKTFPPSRDKYDRCRGEVFTLITRWSDHLKPHFGYRIGTRHVIRADLEH